MRGFWAKKLNNMQITDLIGKKIAVRCETPEQSEAMQVMCKEYTHYKEVMPLGENKAVCYSLDLGFLQFADEPWYLSEGFEIVGFNILTITPIATPDTEFINAAAIAAMQGMISSGGRDMYTEEHMASVSYKHAIAMNTQRKLVNAGKA